MNSEISSTLDGVIKHTAVTFGRIVNSPVTFKLLTYDTASLSKVSDFFKLIEGEVFIVVQTISGDIRGAAIMIFPSENSEIFGESDSYGTVNQLLRDKTAKLEILNMLVGNLLTELNHSLKVTAVQSVPSFTSGRIEEVIDAILLEFMDVESVHLTLTEFSIKCLRQEMHFALLFTK